MKEGEVIAACFAIALIIIGYVGMFITLGTGHDVGEWLWWIGACLGVIALLVALNYSSRRV